MARGRIVSPLRFFASAVGSFGATQSQSGRDLLDVVLKCLERVAILERMISMDEFLLAFVSCRGRFVRAWQDRAYYKRSRPDTMA